jgi:DNA-binding LacI/PurR family transcriptional regulator
MAQYANLTPGAVEAVQKLEAELKQQGNNAILLAYSDYAKLSPEALDLVQKLETTLKEQGSEIVLVAYDK